MAEPKIESHSPPGAPAPSSPGTEQAAASTEQTTAEESTAAGEDFHDAGHWATLTGG
ncbi:hypothetical protein ACLX1H_006033 [Fusarium chlamydosporum]